jgi:nitrite reductase/ring-hydroxylating ferredoxin subunit
MARFGSREVADVTFYNNEGVPVLFLDTLKLTNMSNEAERTYITGGRGNPRLLAFDYNRTATFEISDALMNPKSLALQAGVEVETTPQSIHVREVVDVTGGSVTLSQAPNSDVRLYSTVNGYDFDVATGEVVADPATATVTTTLLTPRVIAFYTYEATDNVEKFTIRSDKFSGFYKIVGDTVITNYETKEEEAWQIIIPQAKINSAFEITLEAEGDASVFDMSVDIFKPDVGTEMIHFIKY